MSNLNPGARGIPRPGFLPARRSGSRRLKLFRVQEAGGDGVGQLVRPGIAAEIVELGVAEAGVRLIVQEDKGGIRKPKHNHTLLDLLSKWVYKQYKEHGLKMRESMSKR